MSLLHFIIGKVDKARKLHSYPLGRLLCVFFFAIASCGERKQVEVGQQKIIPGKFLMILGVTQDGGYPQIGCEKECCRAYWEGKESRKHVVCLALVDNRSKEYWLFEATPDIIEQLHSLQSALAEPDYNPYGIFLTHAHIGHYAGLMQLGREAMGARDIPVYAMPRLDSFLRSNGPWSQLVSLHNIRLHKLTEDSALSLGDSLRVEPLVVPHRDEFSETVGFLIESARKKVLFIPDIDKWEKWNRDIIEELGKVDLAFVDGTFYRNGELPGRDMSEIPHPFVEETIQKLKDLPDSIRSRVYFIHFNHSNPLLRNGSKEKEDLRKLGFGVAEEGMIVEL